MIRVLNAIAHSVAYARSAVRRKLLQVRGASIGDHTYISPTAYIDTHKPGHVSVGRNCYITRNVVILCHSDTAKGGPLGVWESDGGRREYADVVIGDNVFIGVNAVIMPGVEIGDNCIIGALSLVTENIPAGSVAAGVPAGIKGRTEGHVQSTRKDS